MPGQLNPLSIKGLGVNGVIRESSVDSSLIPDGAVVESLNVNFDRVGAISLRPGMTILGTAMVSGATYPCLGFQDCIFANDAYGTLVTVFSDSSYNDIYQFNGTVWSKTLEDDTKDLKTRFVNFADRTIRVNGTDNMKCWNGSGSWETSGPPVNPDQMADYDTKFIEVFKARVYTAGNSTYPDRLFFSTVIDTTGTITFVPTTDYVDINPNDGENISALKRYSTELEVFKPNYIYRFKTSSVDPDPLIKIGTRSQESVIEGKKGLYFHHDSGFYRYTGGYPTEISRPISDFIEAIPFSYYDDISSWKDSDHIYWSVGDLTVQGDSWTNVVLRFTESSEVWTIYSYPTEVRFGSNYNTSSTISQVIGDDNGSVSTFNSGLTDNGIPISYKFVTKWYDFGTVEERKRINMMVATCEKAQGSKLEYQVDDNKNWENIGQLTKYMNYYDSLAIKFHRIRFKIYGMSIITPFVFQGIHLVDWASEGVVKE